MSRKKPKRRHVAKRKDATVERQHVHVESHASEVSVARFHSGPLPPAEEASAYESILPGAFDRILSMAEHQAEHRRAQETKIVDGAMRVEPRGQWLAFVIALTVISCGTLLVVLDKSVEGLSAILTTLGILVGVFIQQKRRRYNETAEKADPTAVGPGRLDTPPPVGRQNGGST